MTKTDITKQQIQDWLDKNKENLVKHSKNIAKWLSSILFGVPKNTLQWLRRAARLWDMHISEKEFISQLLKKDPSFPKDIYTVEEGKKEILKWIRGDKDA